MQIDLQPPMEITKITQSNQNLDFVRDGNAYFVTLKEQQVVERFMKSKLNTKVYPK